MTSENWQEVFDIILDNNHRGISFDNLKSACQKIGVTITDDFGDKLAELGFITFEIQIQDGEDGFGLIFASRDNKGVEYKWQVAPEVIVYQLRLDIDRG